MERNEANDIMNNPLRRSSAFSVALETGMIVPIVQCPAVKAVDPNGDLSSMALMNDGSSMLSYISRDGHDNCMALGKLETGSLLESMRAAACQIMQKSRFNPSRIINGGAADQFLERMGGMDAHTGRPSVFSNLATDRLPPTAGRDVDSSVRANNRLS